MSRRVILILLAVVMLIGATGVGYLGYRYLTRNRVAVGTYRLVLGEGVTMQEVIQTERRLMTTDELLKGVIKDLDLTDHWGHDDEAETLAHLRKNLLVQNGKEKAMLKVVYLDKNQEMALAVLKEISDRYVAEKRRLEALYGAPKPAPTGDGQ